MIRVIILTLAFIAIPLFAHDTNIPLYNIDRVGLVKAAQKHLEVEYPKIIDNGYKLYKLELPHEATAKAWPKGENKERIIVMFESNKRKFVGEEERIDDEGVKRHHKNYEILVVIVDIDSYGNLISIGDTIMKSSFGTIVE